MTTDHVCSDLCPKAGGQDVDILESVRSHIGANALHWHNKGLELATLTVGGAVAIATVAFTRDNLDRDFNIALASLIFIIGAVGWKLIRYVRGQFYEQAGILKKIDLRSGTFCKGRFGLDDNERLYPDSWYASGTNTYREPLIENAARICFLTCLVLCCLVLFVTLRAG
jgi:hypothetical protein